MLPMREEFLATTERIIDADPDVAVVLADISAAQLAGAARRHPDRVINVGIREQLLVSTGAGLALAGLRPIVHTFPSFLVERAFEQIKLDFRTRRWAGSSCRGERRTTCRQRAARTSLRRTWP